VTMRGAGEHVETGQAQPAEGGVVSLQVDIIESQCPERAGSPPVRPLQTQVRSPPS